MSSTDNTLGYMGSRATLADISPPSTPPRTNGRKTRARDESDGKPCSPKLLPALPSPPASPLPNRSQSTNEDKVSAGDKNQPSVSKLRALLGIDSWKCGASTLKERPCKNKIPNSKTDIDTQIESVINCSHSSPKLLRDELDKLAGLVHCHKYHNIPIKRHSRVDSWRNEFNLEESIEEEIAKTLKYYPVTCVGMDEYGTDPCQNGIGGRHIGNREKTINIILNPDTYLNDKVLEYFLQVLNVSMFCDEHIYQGPEKVEAWKKEIQKIRKERNRDKAPEDEDSTTQPTSLLPDRDPADYWTPGFDTSPFNIIASDISDDFKSSFTKIHRKLKKPLKPSDQTKGYIYAYEVEGNAGFVKIGYTSYTPEERLEKWDFYCNRKPIVLYPIPPTPRMMLPNAHRVEELCHAELKHRNIKIYCHCCQRTHIEWFKVSPEEAIAVIQKWSRWMMASPYEPGQYKMPWGLKEKESEKVKGIDRFMKGLAADEPLKK